MAVGAVRGRLVGNLANKHGQRSRSRRRKSIQLLVKSRKPIGDYLAIRAEIEAAGYLTGRLPSAQFDLGGRDEAYRRYILENFPETAKSK